ncbi:MAG: class I SAM-dependent methyltransferase [Dehalococcoidia bacterium]
MPSLFELLYDPLARLFEPRGVRNGRALLVRDLAGEVLEVGAGTGANFRYYAAGARVTAIDHSAYMVRRARPRAEQAKAQIGVQQADVHALPFEDGQYDHTVGTQVLCSVREPERYLAEIRRVTKPGGSIRLIEHVRADGGWPLRLQSWVTPVWRLAFDGCHLNRDTLGLIRGAGFTIETVEDLGGMPLIRNKRIHARAPGSEGGAAE